MSSAALSYFVAVAEAGSFTAAARELHISQPSLSVAIKKLEEELDTQLLVRGRRGVSLTVTGEALLRNARLVLGTLERARHEIHELEEEPRGHFTIGAHESLAAYCLPRFMASFLSAHPGIELSMWNGNSRDVERAVVERDIDLGLVVNPQKHPDCVVRPLFSDRVELIVSAALRRKYDEPLPDLIASHPLIYVPALRQVQYLLGALAQRDVVPGQHLSCSSLELVKSLVLDGVGVGMLPFRVATYGGATGRVAPVSHELPWYDDHIALVRRWDMHVTTAARLLLDALEDHGKSMPTLPRRR